MGRNFDVTLHPCLRNEAVCDDCGRWNSRIEDGLCPKCREHPRNDWERAVRAARGDYDQDPAEGC